jgi:MFS family permease
VGAQQRAVPDWLRILLAGQFVTSAGPMVVAFLPLYLVSARGLSESAAGLMAGVYGAGVIGGSLVGGSIGDRIGHRRALMGAESLAALGCALVPLVPDPALPVVVLVPGLGLGLARPVLFALATEGVPPASRRQAVAMLRAVDNAGIAIGPLLGGLAAAWHFEVIFVADSASSLVFVLFLAVRVPDPSRLDDPDQDAPATLLASLRRDRRMLLLLGTIIAVDTSYRFAYAGMSFHLHELGARPWVYGATITLNCVLIVMLEPWLAGRLRARETSSLLAIGFALVGLGWAVVAAVPTIAAAFVAVTVVTFGEMLYKPTATAHAADSAPAGMVGRYQSVYGAASITGEFLSPPICGVLFVVSVQLMWWVGAALAVLPALLIALAWRRLPALR